MTITSRQVFVEEKALQAFSAGLDGILIQPGDAGYDQARAVWNGMIDRYPVLIVQCQSVQDVIASVNFAREQRLLLAVRGGGHNVAGHGTVDGGLVIDLSRMKGIEVDPVARIARVQGGATWGDVDAVTQAYGLATPGGVFSKTGVAGLTLGGGFGWLNGKFGLSCDNLIGAQVVTADGRLVRASKTENSDLLWGLRGGGGNFGIVTTFEFSLHPVGPEVMFTFVFHDGRGEKMKRAIQFYRDYVKDVPDEVSSIMACGIVPPEPELFRQEIHGLPFILFAGLYAGPVDAGRQAMQPLTDFGEPLVDHSGVVPFVDAQKMFDEDYPDGMRYYWKSLNLSRLDDEVIDRIVKHARKQPSPYSTTDLWQIGAAVKNRTPEDGAFFNRRAAFLLNPEANWLDAADDKANLAWVRDFIADMQEFSDGGRYLNFPGFQEEGSEMVRKSYGPHYERLAALKDKYDPHNLFRLNQNIPPSP